MSVPDSRKPSPRQAGYDQPMLFSVARGIDLRPHKSIRIAVTGDVALNRLETEIIDTPDYQRLRRIKQLGATDHVYPTALHTRFDHSLGTLGIAMEMVQAIRENRRNSDEERFIEPEQEQLIRLFALLHDIGHIPYGHTIEDEFCIFPRHDKDPERMQRFLGSESIIGRILHARLGFDLYARFLALINADGGPVERLGEDLFINDLVNNTVCADLLDYLRRDCYFCNITFDLDYRFLRYLYLKREGKVRRMVVRLWKDGQPAPRRDVISELVRLLDNRYLMAERVYFHHTKLVSGSMIAGAVARAVQAGEMTKQSMYELGDELLLDRLCHSGEAVVRKLAEGVRDRRLWKMVDYKDRQSIGAEEGEVQRSDVVLNIMEGWWKNPADRMNQENSAGHLLGIEEGDFLLHCPSLKMSMKLAETQVYWNGGLRALKDCTDDPMVGPRLAVILQSHENLWALRAFANPAAITPDAGRFLEKKSVLNYMLNVQVEAQDKPRGPSVRELVESLAREEGIGLELAPGEFSRGVDEAASALMGYGQSRVRPEAIRAAIRFAFPIHSTNKERPDEEPPTP